MKPTQFDSPIAFDENSGPVDEELLFIVEVLQGRATRAAESEFERRVVADDAFHAKAGPLMLFFELTPAEVRAIVEEVQGLPGANAAPQSGQPVAQALPLTVPPVEAPPAESRYGAPPLTRGQSLFREAKLVLLAGAWIAFAVVVVGMVVVGYVLIEATAEKPDGVIAVTRVAKSAGTTKSAEGAEGAEGAGNNAADPERASTRARYALDMTGQTASADSSQALTVELRGGTRIRVRPGSRVRYADDPWPLRSASLEVFGEAAIDVTEDGKLVSVISRAGIARLNPGSFAVRCVGECAALEVTVAQGSAGMMTDRVRGHRVYQLLSGQYGLLFRDSSRIVPPQEAAGFPMPDSTLRKSP